MYIFEPRLHSQFPSSDAVHKLMVEGAFSYDNFFVEPEITSSLPAAPICTTVVLSNLPPFFVKVNISIVL